MENKKIKVVFMGTPIFARTILEGLIEHYDVALVVSQPDAPVGRKKILTPSPVKEYAESLNIPVFTPNKIREDYKEVIDASPDIIITCAYGQIVPKEILECPRLGCINVHASLLPKLRGGAPIHHAIMDGLDETGITIMYMDEHMDSGDIIKEEKISIEQADTLDSLGEKLQKLGTELLLDVLPSIIDGTNDRIKQNEKEATYGYIIKKEDEHIDFTKTAKEVYNKIRGLNSSPGAYMLLNGEVIKVYESRIGTKKGSPGKIIEVYKDGIGIACKDSEIIITKIKPSGKKELLVKDYLNGVKKESILGKMCE